MKHHKAFEMVSNIAPKDAYVSVAKDIAKSNTGEMLTEWSLYISNQTNSVLGTGATFDEAYGSLIGALSAEEE